MDDIYGRFKRPDSDRPAQSYNRPTVPPRRVEPPRSVSPPPAKQQPYFVPPKKSKKGKTIVIILLVIVLLGGGGAAGAVYYKKNQAIRDRLNTGEPAPADPLPEEEQAAESGKIRLVATGDMIAHESINKNAQKPDGGYDYAALMSDMKPFFTKADIRFCNQATPAGGSEFGISGYPNFNAPVEFARGIESVGCNLVNIGTNHTNDKGQTLVDATVKTWDDRKGVLAVAGANRSAEERGKLRTFSVKDMKFAFLSYTTYTNKPVTNGFGVNMYDESKAKAEIAEARKQADFVIISMRWGTEYSPDINASQDQIAQVLTDAGADVILGHGPHDMQPVKKLKAADGREAPVWFSLGNFLSSQLDIQNLIGGFAIMDIDVATKKISAISFLPVYQHYEWSADQARRRNNADLLARNNFKMVPLDKATDLLVKSHHNTTVEAQTERVKALLNKFTEVQIIKSDQY